MNDPIDMPADSQEEENNTEVEKNTAETRKFQQRMPNPIYEISCIQASLATKASPLVMNSWIGTALTLDGRDKITKVIQYSSRFLGFYYETIADKIANGTISDTRSATSLRLIELFLSRATRFRNLQKSLTKSRKAYRLGRTMIELEKLKNIGFVHWIAWYLRQHLVQFHHPLQLNAESEQVGSAISWHPDIKDVTTKEDGAATNKTIGTIQAQSCAPPRIKLPRQVSSNLGPTTIIPSKRNDPPASYRQLSSISRLVYRSLSSFIDARQNESKEAPPMWKIISSSFKLLGLAGFWAADNVSFLYSSGFLIDDAGGSSKPGRAKDASIFAARSYFFAAVSGLYLNMREFIRHRNGRLKEATMNLYNCKSQIKTINNQGVDAYEKHQKEQEVERFEAELEITKQKHANLSIALLKSCCDVIVFSNNPGIDLHLKYRGHRMSEGIQCAFGVTSALTVIYNNFPKYARK